MTNFQDLVAKVENLVALAPVLGAISCPALGFLSQTGLVLILKGFSNQFYGS